MERYVDVVVVGEQEVSRADFTPPGHCAPQTLCSVSEVLGPRP